MSHFVQGFGAKRGRGGDGWAKAWLGTGAGKVVRRLTDGLDGTASTAFPSRSGVLRCGGFQGRCVVNMLFGALTEYVGVWKRLNNARGP
jgi:hypothetical protein